MCSSDLYSVYRAEGGTGYALINRNTDAIEGYVDQEPPAVMTLLMLQEAYDDVMGDPEREYKVRKQQRAAVSHVPAGKAGILAN